MSFKWISVSQLVLPEKRLREKDEAIDELAASMKEKGVLQPIIVRQKGDMFEVVAGERRVKAAMLAGLSEVPAVVRNFTDAEADVARLIENIQREDLSDYEIAKALKALLDSGAYKSAKGLAYFLGKSEAWVSKHLGILEEAESFPGEIRDKLAERRLKHERKVLAPSGSHIVLFRRKERKRKANS